MFKKHFNRAISKHLGVTRAKSFFHTLVYGETIQTLYVNCSTKFWLKTMHTLSLAQYKLQCNLWAISMHPYKCNVIGGFIELT